MRVGRPLNMRIIYTRNPAHARHFLGKGVLSGAYGKGDVMRDQCAYDGLYLQPLDTGGGALMRLVCVRWRGPSDGEWMGGGIFVSDGDAWSKRREFAKTLFHSSSLRSHVPVFSSTAKRLGDRFRDLAMHKGQVDVQVASAVLARALRGTAHGQRCTSPCGNRTTSCDSPSTHSPTLGSASLSTLSRTRARCSTTRSTTYVRTECAGAVLHRDAPSSPVPQPFDTLHVQIQMKISHRMFFGTWWRWFHHDKVRLVPRLLLRDLWSLIAPVPAATTHRSTTSTSRL